MFGQSGFAPRPVCLIVTPQFLAVSLDKIETIWVSTSGKPKLVDSTDESQGVFGAGVFAETAASCVDLTAGLDLTDAELQMFAIGLYEGLSDPNCPFPLCIEEMLVAMRQAMDGRTAEECLADRARGTD